MQASVAVRRRERSLVTGTNRAELQSCRCQPLQGGFNVRVSGELTTRGGGNVAWPGSWSGWLGVTICSKEFNKRGFDVESQGRPSIPVLTLS